MICKSFQGVGVKRIVDKSNIHEPQFQNNVLIWSILLIALFSRNHFQLKSSFFIVGHPQSVSLLLSRPILGRFRRCPTNTTSVKLSHERMSELKDIIQYKNLFHMKKKQLLVQMGKKLKQTKTNFFM